jgi:hypothetical protein
MTSATNMTTRPRAVADFAALSASGARSMTTKFTKASGSEFATPKDYIGGRRRSAPDTAEDAAAIAAYCAPKGAKAPKDAKQAAKDAYERSAAKPGAGLKEKGQSPFWFYWGKVTAARAAGEAGASAAMPWKDTVCMSEALKAMRSLTNPLKGASKLPRKCVTALGPDMGIVMEGYASALRAWNKCALARDLRDKGLSLREVATELKAKGFLNQDNKPYDAKGVALLADRAAAATADSGSICAYLQATAQGAIQNAAWEQFSKSGKRQREPGEVMPKMVSLKPDSLAHSSPHECDPSTLRTDPAPDYEDDSGDDSEPVELAYTIAKDDKQAALRFTAPVNSIAGTTSSGELAAKDRLDYQDPKIVAAAKRSTSAGSITPPGKAIYGGQETADRSRIVAIEGLLSGLRPADRMLISRVYGTDGHAEMSIRDLAKQNGCSESAMSHRIDRIKEEIRNSVTFV